MEVRLSRRVKRIMTKSKFRQSQIVAALRQGEAGLPVALLFRKHGMSRPTYFNWKGMNSDTSGSELQRRCSSN